jgi:hypothetical protein
MMGIPITLMHVEIIAKILAVVMGLLMEENNVMMEIP